MKKFKIKEINLH